jgi:hypothetical protein
MADVKWEIKGREFVNCNCDYGCPCQFNALPTKGFCQAVGAFEVQTGHHGSTKLDGLKGVAIMAWPGPIHLGNGEAQLVIDQRGNDAQRDALIKILAGQDTEPGATIFQVFSATFAKVHDTIFADIDFQVDVEKRMSRLKIAGVADGRGEPIRNPVTGDEFRGRIDLPNGFEYTLAEMGRGWTKTTSAIKLDLQNSYGQFADIHLSQSGIVR